MRAVRRDVRSLTMKRLALAAIRGDREAAMVLGDAMHERGLDRFASLDRFETGRTRNVRFLVSNLNPDIDWPAHVLRRSESSYLPQRRCPCMPFLVKGKETLINVERFASAPSEETWGDIFRMWVTRERDIYRDLHSQGILPSRVSFRELEFQKRYYGIPGGSGEGLNYEVYLVRSAIDHRVGKPPRRKRPVKTRLFSLDRMDDPETITTHFGRPDFIAG